MKFFTIQWALLGLMFLLFTTGCTEKQTKFPSKPVTIVVPWDAGGGTDALARSLALQASEVFGQVVNVLNRPGGSGAVGHSFGSTARPDGYTVTMITYELCTYQPLGRLQLTPANFKPVIQLNEDPGAITVHADSPWKTLKEFLDYAREHPGEATVGNSGPGAVWHIGALKLEKVAGVRFTHVPHNGAKPAVTQLLGKHLDAVSVSPAEVLQYLQLGTLRCLGVMSEERDPQLPDVPTLREQGFDVIHGTWRGLAVPLNTPDALVAVLEQGFKQSYDSPEFQDTAKKALLGLRYRGSQQFKTYLTNEYQNVNNLLSGSDIVVKPHADIYRIPHFYEILFVIFLIILGVRTAFKTTPSLYEETGISSTSRLKMAAIIFAALLVYTTVMLYLGYIFSTLLFLAGMMLYLGERRVVRVSALSVCVMLVIYFIFKNILDVPLPAFWG